LTINAAPRQGFTPLRVTFRGELEGVVANDEEYYCLQEIWDFGDGAKSSEKPNCDPYSAESKVKTEFFMDHVYEKAGRYTVRLMLGEEDNEKIKSRQTSVAVLERTTGGAR
jgi:PKD repeat protein